MHGENLKLNEIRLRMFDKRVLRGLSGVKREEVADRWKKIHN